MRIATVIFFGLSVSPFFDSVALADIQYTVMQLPWSPTAINNAGIVLVGGAIWQGGSTLEYAPSSSVDFVSGTGINPAGAVAGSAQLPDGSSPYGPAGVGPAAAVWQNGQVRVLPAVQSGPVLSAQATGINSEGVVVGYSAAGSDVRAVRWTHGSAQDLTSALPSGSGKSVAQALNDLGQIVITVAPQGGSIWNGSTDQSFVLNNGVTTPIALTSPTVTGIHAETINQGGTVAGAAYFTDGSGQAFRWSNGEMELAPSLFPLVPGTNVATAINAANTAVGYFFPADQSKATAFLWKNGSSPVDLNTLIAPMPGLHLYAAYGINDSGEIVGAGTIDGEPLGFLLTPTTSSPRVVPEPTTLLLLSTLPLLLRRRPS